MKTRKLGGNKQDGDNFLLKDEKPTNWAGVILKVGKL
jgi:hypothetical protein